MRTEILPERGEKRTEIVREYYMQTATIAHQQCFLICDE